MPIERLITYAEAICEATAQEMRKNKSIIVLGMGVDDFKGTFGTTKGLVQEFGRERVFDTPLAEDGMTGVAIGAALAGLHPIHVHIRMDFLLLAMNQLINIAAKARSMYGGSVRVPLVVRSVIGRSWGQGAQHSQGLQSLFMHIPGLRVVAPSTPYDAKGTIIASLRESNPVIFIEHRMLHLMKGHVPKPSYRIPLGKARVLRNGSDITIVGISHMAVEALAAAHLLKGNGIHAEVIDPIWLAPLDEKTIMKSVRKTGRLLVCDSAWTSAGASAEIVARVAEEFAKRGERIQVGRMGFAPVVCPPSRPLENRFYPNPKDIAIRAAQMVKPARRLRVSRIPRPEELAEFRGPF